MVNVFVYLSVIIFWFLFFVWKSDDFLNMLVKTVLGFMGVYGLIVAASMSGYIIKVN